MPNRLTLPAWNRLSWPGRWAFLLLVEASETIHSFLSMMPEPCWSSPAFQNHARSSHGLTGRAGAVRPLWGPKHRRRHRLLRSARGYEPRLVSDSARRRRRTPASGRHRVGAGRCDERRSTDRVSQGSWAAGGGLVCVVEGRRARGECAAPVDQVHFSPDGRWVAYNTAAEGRRQDVYVSTYPATGARWLISTGGGVQPIWRSDGKELFYLGL